MKYGFIGCGNMGGAIAQALAKCSKDILISDPSSKSKLLAADLGCSYSDNLAVANNCERIFLAVKPQMMEKVLAPLSSVLAQRKPLLITMAAGIEMKRIAQLVGTDLPIIRIMPNTPVSVGKGMIVYCSNDLVAQEIVTDFLKDMQFAGTLDQLDEKLIDVASALSGSGPAYMYVFLEAMADGAVACGLPRDKAIAYAAATMDGAAQMLRSTGKHPGELKDAVCSPAGSTIVGLQALESHAFRGAVMECVISAWKKNKELGQ